MNIKRTYYLCENENEFETVITNLFNDLKTIALIEDIVDFHSLLSNKYYWAFDIQQFEKFFEEQTNISWEDNLELSQEIYIGWLVKKLKFFPVFISIIPEDDSIVIDFCSFDEMKDLSKNIFGLNQNEISSNKKQILEKIYKSKNEKFIEEFENNIYSKKITYNKNELILKVMSYNGVMVICYDKFRKQWYIESMPDYKTTSIIVLGECKNDLDSAQR
jgi:hypothetical protein